MSTKTASRFFSIQQAILGLILIACAVTWPVAHIIKGTMNTPSAIFSIAMIGGSLFLGCLAWKDLKNDFKKTKPQSKIKYHE